MIVQANKYSQILGGLYCVEWCTSRMIGGDQTCSTALLYLALPLCLPPLLHVPCSLWTSPDCSPMSWLLLHWLAGPLTSWPLWRKLLWTFWPGPVPSFFFLGAHTVLVSPVVASWVIGLRSLKSGHLGDGKLLSNFVLGSSLDRLLTLLSLCNNVDWIRFSASWSSTFKHMPSPSLSS